MTFKHDVLKTQFELIDQRLRAILLELDWYTQRWFNKEIVITSLLRDKGIHKYGRGGDVRSSMFKYDEKIRILTHLNTYIYDIARPQYRTVLLHNVGLGTHFHIQVAPIKEVKNGI